LNSISVGRPPPPPPPIIYALDRQLIHIIKEMWDVSLIRTATILKLLNFNY
jgi:hypothetical protein